MDNQDNKIIITEVTDYGVTITLKNGITFSLSSNKDYFYISLSGTELPLKWGYHPGPTGIIGESNNTISCFYKPRNYS